MQQLLGLHAQIATAIDLVSRDPLACKPARARQLCRDCARDTAAVTFAVQDALEFDLNNGATPVTPIYRLEVVVTPTDVTLGIDPVSGRPNEEIGGVQATYQLVEITTGKIVVKDSTSARASCDIPGTQQRFAKQRAQVDAQDRAANVAAEAIRNRLASYFVAAGTRCCASACRLRNTHARQQRR